jgi:HSP20 family protein
MHADRRTKDHPASARGTDDDPWPGGSDRVSSWVLRRGSHLWRPPTDLCETEEAIVVTVEVAGMREAEFSVSLDRQVLSIRGVRGDRLKAKAYHQLEIAYGEFLAQVQVPAAIEAARIQADYSDGFLRVVLPKVRPARVAVTRRETKPQ